MASHLVRCFKVRHQEPDARAIGRRGMLVGKGTGRGERSCSPTSANGTVFFLPSFFIFSDLRFASPSGEARMCVAQLMRGTRRASLGSQEVVRGVGPWM